MLCLFRTMDNERISIYIYRVNDLSSTVGMLLKSSPAIAALCIIGVDAIIVKFSTLQYNRDLN